METYKWKEDLEIFLGGTFHQDIESPQEALEEYLKEYLKEDKEHIKYMVGIITDFLNSSLSDEEKNNFIELNTEVYFPTIGIRPISWLEEVKSFFVAGINRK